jgi:5'-nucleotidase
VADFDRTLTSAYVDGKPRPGLENIFQKEWHLWPEYTQKSKERFEKYYPIEIDPAISVEEKKKIMPQRWIEVFNGMIAAWLRKDMIKSAMQSDQIQFRPWNETFFALLEKNTIPLLIFSAGGLGFDGIQYCLEKHNKLYKNIGIIANTFIRDENDKAIGVKEPIIHSFNKGETVIKNFPIYTEIKERKNVLLLWDSLGDVHMADGFDYNNIIKIWFLNHDTPENRALYLEKYDLLILDDGPMDEVNNILKKILE